MVSIGIGIGIENPKFPSIGIGIGIEKLILQVLVLGLVLTPKGIHSQSCSRYPKETFNHLLFQTNYPKVLKQVLFALIWMNSSSFVNAML